MSARPSSLSLSIAADAQALTVVRHVLDGLAAHDRLPDPVLDDLQIAVGEACGNVVVHAYAGRPVGPLDIDVAFEATRVVVTVRDQGVGLSPTWQESATGMGIPMMKALTDDLTFGTGTGDGTGHEVRMTFPLGPS
jgi:serine/threonine-protein kinase RsbW